MEGATLHVEVGACLALTGLGFHRVPRTLAEHRVDSAGAWDGAEEVTRPDSASGG